MNDFLELAQITFFTPENSEFKLTENGFASLKAFIPPITDDLAISEEGSEKPAPVWQELGRVWFHRMFPFELPNEFISVQNKEGKEYGVIRRISDFGEEAAAVINSELTRKYLCPEITKILSMKEKLGTSYWEVLSDMGKLRFSMQDTFRNIIKISETRIVLCDVDGNRYSIMDVNALDRKSYRKIELYL